MAPSHFLMTPGHFLIVLSHFHGGLRDILWVRNAFRGLQRLGVEPFLPPASATPALRSLRLDERLAQRRDHARERHRLTGGGPLLAIHADEELLGAEGRAVA